MNIEAPVFICEECGNPSTIDLTPLVSILEEYGTMMMLPMSIVMIHNRLISIHDDVSLHTLTHWLNHDARFTEHRYKPYYWHLSTWGDDMAPEVLWDQETDRWVLNDKIPACLR